MPLHGHFDVPAFRIDTDQGDSELTPERINTGIAIVVPASKIKEGFDVHSPVGASPVQIGLCIFSDQELSDPELNVG